MTTLRLGHADFSIILKTCNHVIPNLEGKTATAMEEALM